MPLGHSDTTSRTTVRLRGGHQSDNPLKGDCLSECPKASLGQIENEHADDHRTTYELTLRAEGPDPRPPIIRLRSLLKLMLRGFGLRCVTIREIPADRSPQQAGPAA